MQFFGVSIESFKNSSNPVLSTYILHSSLKCYYILRHLQCQSGLCDVLPIKTIHYLITHILYYPKLNHDKQDKKGATLTRDSLENIILYSNYFSTKSTDVIVNSAASSRAVCPSGTHVLYLINNTYAVPSSAESSHLPLSFMLV